MTLPTDIKDLEFKKFVDSGGYVAVRVVDMTAGVSWDYMAPTYGATSTAYVFKTGGSGGTVVQTITINYTDATKTVILSVVKS